MYVWYIYLHEWLIFMVNEGKYTSPMDPVGKEIYSLVNYWKISHFYFWEYIDLHSMVVVCLL